MHSDSPNQYIGRFAPSPSGPLHMGSLVAALASYLDARSHNGLWLMRMEDLDPPRESKVAADQILFALDEIGLHWDAEVLYQSHRDDAYQAAIDTLQKQGLVFACDCSRQQIQEAGGVYPGTCRLRNLPATDGTALRLKVADQGIGFTDNIQGNQSQQLAQEVGDFVIRRKDGLFAYQLAVVVDDAFQNITHIVRGIDLMDSTARQLYLQSLLGMTQPEYAHIPVIVNELGQKLSKQHMAKPVDSGQGQRLLYESLLYLKQSPEPALKSATTTEILEWGIAHWNPEKLKDIRSLKEF